MTRYTVTYDTAGMVYALEYRDGVSRDPCAVEPWVEAHDLNATGEPLRTAEDLADFIQQMHVQGAFPAETAREILDQARDLRRSVKLSCTDTGHLSLAPPGATVGVPSVYEITDVPPEVADAAVVRLAGSTAIHGTAVVAYHQLGFGRIVRGGGHG